MFFHKFPHKRKEGVRNRTGYASLLHYQVNNSNPLSKKLRDVPMTRCKQVIGM
jgi:hypothetical protein